MEGYRDPLDRFRIKIIALIIFQAAQAVSDTSFQVPLDIKMRIPIFVIYPPTFLCNFLHSMLAFRCGLVV